MSDTVRYNPAAMEAYLLQERLRKKLDARILFGLAQEHVVELWKLKQPQDSWAPRTLAVLKRQFDAIEGMVNKLIPLLQKVPLPVAPLIKHVDAFLRHIESGTRFMTGQVIDPENEHALRQQLTQAINVILASRQFKDAEDALAVDWTILGKELAQKRAA